MRRSLLAGVVLAALGFLLVDHGGHLGIGFSSVVLLGGGLGAVVGLVPDRTPAWRAGAFLIGFLLSWAGYALRAGLLPDIPLGHALAVLIVLLLATAVAAASSGRLPLWALLVGLAAFAGAYETTFNLNPTRFLDQSLTAGSTSLLAAALGFLVTTVVGELMPPGVPGAGRERPAEPGDQDTAGLDIVAGDRPATGPGAAPSGGGPAGPPGADALPAGSASTSTEVRP